MPSLYQADSQLLIARGRIFLRAELKEENVVMLLVS